MRVGLWGVGLEGWKGCVVGAVSLIIPYCGRRTKLRRFILRAGGIVGSLPRCSFECVLMGSNDGSEACLVVGGLTGAFGGVGCVSFSQGFNGRTTVCTKLERAATSCIIIVSTSLRRPPRLFPRVVRTIRRRNCSYYTAGHTSHRNRDGFEKVFSGLFFGLSGELASMGVPCNTVSFHVVDHRVISSVLRLDRIREFSGNVFS